MSTQACSGSKEPRTLKMVLSSDEEDEDDDNSDMGNDSSSDNGTTERCAICLGCIKGNVGSPDAVGCDHYFCLLCILEWAKNNATCPQDRRYFNNVLVMSCVGGSITEKIPVEVKKEDDAFDYTADDLTYCEVCGSCEREDSLLLCDGCDLGYHLDCLTPPLSEVPVEEWFCPTCVKADLPLAIQQSLLKDEKETSLLQMFRRPSTTCHRRLIPRTRATERVIQRIHKSRGSKTLKRQSKRRKRNRKQRSDEDYSDEEGSYNKKVFNQNAYNEAFPKAKKYGGYNADDIDAQFNNDDWANKLLNPAPSTSLDNEAKKFKALSVLNNNNKPSPGYQGHSYHPKVNLSLPAMPDILTAILGSPTSFTSSPLSKLSIEEKKKNVNLSGTPKLDFGGSSLFLPIPLPSKKRDEEMPENVKKDENKVEKSKKVDELKDSDEAYDPMDVLDKFDDVYDPLDDVEKFDDVYDPLDGLDKSDESCELLSDLEKSDVIYVHNEKLNKSLEVVKKSDTKTMPLEILDKPEATYNPLDKLENSKLSNDSIDILELPKMNTLDDKKWSCENFDLVKGKDSDPKVHKMVKSDQNDKNKTLSNKDYDKHSSSSNKFESPKYIKDKNDSSKHYKDKYDSSKYKQKRSGKTDKCDSYSKEEKYYYKDEKKDSHSKDVKHMSYVKGEKYDSHCKDEKFSHYSKLEKYNSYSKGEKCNSSYKDEKYSRYGKDSKYFYSKDSKYKHEYSSQRRSKSKDDYYKEKSSQKYNAKSKYDPDRSRSIERKKRKQHSRSSSTSSTSSRSSSRSRSKSRSKKNWSPDSPDNKLQKAVKHSSKLGTSYHSKSPEKQKKKKLKSLWGHFYSETSEPWVGQPKDLQLSKHSLHSMNIPSLGSKNKSSLIILSPDGQSNGRFSDSLENTKPASSTPLGVVRIFSNDEASLDSLVKEGHKNDEIVLDDSNSSNEKQLGFSNVLKAKFFSNSDVIKEKRAKSKKSKKKSKSKKREKSVSDACKEKLNVNSSNFTNELTMDYDINKEKELVDSNIKILTDASNIKILTDAFINEMAELDGKKFFETKDIPGLANHSELFQRESVKKLKPSMDTKIKKMGILEPSEFAQKDSVKGKTSLETKAPTEMEQKKKPSLSKAYFDSYHPIDIFLDDSEKIQSSLESKAINAGLADQSVADQGKISTTMLPSENKNKKKLLSESSEFVPNITAVTEEESLDDKCKKQNVTPQSGFDQKKFTKIRSSPDSKSSELKEKHELGSVKSTLLSKSKHNKSEMQPEFVHHNPVILKPYLASKNNVTGFTEHSDLIQKGTIKIESDLVNTNKNSVYSEVLELTDSFSVNDNKKLKVEKQSNQIQEPNLKSKSKMTVFVEKSELIQHEPAKLKTGKESKSNKADSSEQTVENINKKGKLFEQSGVVKQKSSTKLPYLESQNQRLDLADKHELVDDDPAIIKADYLNDSSLENKFTINFKLKDKHVNSQSSLDSMDTSEDFIIDEAKTNEVMLLDEKISYYANENRRKIEDEIKLKKMKDIFGTGNIEEGSDSPYDPCQEIEGSLSVEEMSPCSIPSSSPKQNVGNLNLDVNRDIRYSHLELNSPQLSKASYLNMSSSPYSPSHSPSFSPEMKVKLYSPRKPKKLPDLSPHKIFKTKPADRNDQKITETELKPYKSNSHLCEEDFKLSGKDSSVTEKLLRPSKINNYGCDFQTKSNTGEESNVKSLQREICNQKVKSFFVDDGLQREICDQTVKSFFDQFASPVKFEDSDSDDTVRSKLKKIDQNLNKENVSQQSHAHEWEFNSSNDSVKGIEIKNIQRIYNTESKMTSFEDSFIDSMESPESPESDGELMLPATLKLESKNILAVTETRSARRLSSKNKPPVDRTLLEAKVVEEAKRWLNPYYIDKCFSKEVFKEIMAKIVRKVIVVEYSLDIQPRKIQKLVDGYVQVYLHRNRKKKKAAGNFSR